MARKSRKVVSANENIEYSEKALTSTVRTAVYARMSLEDKVNSESTSIETQIYMLEKYVKDRPYFDHYKTYVDNGFTGTNFERPEFTNMINDIKRGKFDCIIVKDVSRLGRNYLEAGAYLENIFPMFQIRFISVNDNYDSSDPACKRDGLSLPLKNLINEAYSKDLSRKLGTAFRTKQKNGEFIGAYAPYGYLKSKESCNKLVIDEEAAPIVRRIFDMKIKGMSDLAIARQLNEEDIASPFKHRYEQGLVTNEKYAILLWKPGAISDILKNKTYLGHMVQGVHRKSLYHNEKSRRVPETEWVIVENTHVAILRKEIFDEVQEILTMRKIKYFELLSDSPKGIENKLRGIAVCGHCNHKLLITHSSSKSATNYYYRCPKYLDTGEKGCVHKSIRVEDLEDAVYSCINIHMKIFLDCKKTIARLNQTKEAKEKVSSLDYEITEIRRQISRMSKLAGNLYEDYSEHLLTESEYLYTKEKYKSDSEALSARLNEMNLMQNKYGVNYAGSYRWDELVKRYMDVGELSTRMAKEFVKKVKVLSKEDIRVELNYYDEFAEYKAFCEEREKEGLILLTKVV